MEQIAAEELARRFPLATCNECGKLAANCINQTWTIQGSRFRCHQCSVAEGLV